MKNHVLLTGFPGIGKTTLVQKVCHKLQEKGINHQGFYTGEIRNGNRRIGFDVFTLAGKRACLARLGEAEARGPKVGKYIVDVASFENTALPCFDVEVRENVHSFNREKLLELLIPNNCYVI